MSGDRRDLGPWEVVARFSTEEEGALVAGFLESRGIPVERESTIFHQEPVTFGALGDVRLAVPRDRASTARELLARGPGEEWALSEEEEPWRTGGAGGEGDG